MAGHSKWANIKHSKARVDAKRGKIFTKHIREITVSARLGGADINSNSRLRIAVDKALRSNMPKDTIQRAIKRGAGGDESGNLQEIRYEGYGPNGVAVMVDCLTDNKNRTVGEVRHAFTKNGGNLGTDGSVNYLFTAKGLISFPSGMSEDKIMATALELPVEDVVTNTDGSIDVFTTVDEFETVRDAFVKTGLEPEQAEVSMQAAIQVKITEEESAEKMLALVEMLEDLDDVQNVYTNAEIPDAILEKME
jgi:YebC/PmpR family DNA-binding regulatory protein